MEVNPNIAYSMLDRLMGGVGESPGKVDNLTEIETKILTNLFERSFDNLREAWSGIIDIDPLFNRIGSESAIPSNDFAERNGCRYFVQHHDRGIEWNDQYLYSTRRTRTNRSELIGQVLDAVK